MAVKLKEVRRFAAGVLAAFLLCAFFAPVRAAAASAEHQTVKVGFYPVANYQEVKEDGSYSGFSYDYYMQLQKYTRWNYKFVEASYAECMQMLIDGEIDLMSGVGKTSAREEQMIFADYSVSSSQNKLYARRDDERLFYESYDTFDGCRIAMTQGMLTGEMEAYCQRNGFEAEILRYASAKEMEQALLSGEVDMICTAAVSTDTATKIVGRMDKQPLYFVISKQKPEIAQGVNSALRKIVDNNPDFNTQLAEKYMISGANATATFTREELAYIQSGQKVYVILNKAWAPISWYDREEEEYRGIVVDVLRQVAEYSGLNFVLCSEEEFDTMAAQDPTMIDNVLAVLADDNSWAAQQSVMMSNHVVDASVVMVARRGGDLSEDRPVALPSRFYIGYVMQEELKGRKVVYYNTVQDCLDAVNSGRAGSTYVNELVASYFLSMLQYNNLFATANSGYYENLAFAVNRDSDAPLLSILDKSLLCLGSTDMGQIVLQNSIAEERFSLRGLYFSSPGLVLGSVAAILVIVFTAVYVGLSLQARKKRTEQELQKEFETNRARTEFFMMISHELRTPLNAIVGYLELIAEQCRRSGGETEYIRRAQNAAGQLTDISEDMLDYTKIESDSVELHSELFDLKDVVRAVDENIVLKARQKGVKYRFTAQDISHEYVVGDRLRVTQVFQNILANAVKFTDAQGEVEAGICQRMLDKNTVELEFTCRDTGRGMSKEFLKKVCAPFNQSDRAYSRTHGGLGLGLYLTKYFVNAMKGSFAVESRLGEGSRFVITLPLRRPDSGQILESHVDCSHVRALVCGTQEEENGQIRDLLKRLNIRCDVAAEPEKVIKRILSRAGGPYEYALCILDETMLEAENSLAEQVAELSPAPKIFVMTSDAEKIDSLAKSCPLRRVLYKPVFQSELFDAVINTFGEYRTDRAKTEPEDFSGLRAMVVEDNPINADILTRTLKKTQMDVTVCENGQVAVETFEKAPCGTYQIIFMDIQMPVMDGYEAAAAIRVSPKGREAAIPIVAVSANAFPADIQKSMEAGMNEHLSKPVDVHKLYSVIRKYCRDPGQASGPAV
ncbi:MAG: transporter substrate-binding domain-containing protein [Oscillospiraceae bacterium]|nr:transporter substrate-binding domain-containing protein [Oscillospiraceae bacterium]